MKLTIDQVLKQAVEAQKSGQVQEADRLYTAILKAQPKHPDANHNLGVLAVSVGKLQEAVPLLKTALQANPGVVQFWLSYIDTLIKLNKLTEAKNVLDQAKSKGAKGDDFDQLSKRLQKAGQVPLEDNQIEPQLIQPNILDSIKLEQAIKLARKKTKEGYPEEAKRIYHDILLKFPENKRAKDGLKSISKVLDPPQGQVQLLINLYSQGQLQQSLTLAERLVQQFPKSDLLFNIQGVIFQDLGQLDLSISAYKKAIVINPNYADAHNNMGSVLKQQGKLEEAIVVYKKTLAINPNYAEAYYNMGNVLKEQGKLEEAIGAYKKTLVINPNHAKAYSNMGIVLQKQGKLEEAIEAYKKTLAIDSNNSDAYYNMGNVLKEQVKLEEAIGAYKKAQAINPNHARAFNNMAHALKDLGCLTECLASYREAIRLRPDFFMAHSNMLLSLNYQESISSDEVLAQAKEYGAMVSAMNIPKFTSWITEPNSFKLRIGFVSGDLRNHPVGYFVEGLLKNFDRTNYELVSFPTSDIADQLTERVKPYFYEWIPIYGKSDLEAATLIYEQGIQVLIDLSGHTAGNRTPIFAYKPAPVQISWLGYFATTGLPEMDYILGDPFVSPMSEAHHFCESIWQLPETYLCFTPPNEDISVGPLPALANQFITFGCFNSLNKLGESVVELWCNILLSIPDSKLFLKAKQLADPIALSKVIDQFDSHGISKSRLIIERASPREQLLASYNKVDIALDPFPYPGGTTTAEALWMGVPVLTLKGDRFLSHVGESIAHNVGHSDWIAADHEEYVNKAKMFASEISQLTKMRQGLRDKVLQSPLFDAERFAKNFEVAMTGIWKQHTK